MKPDPKFNGRYVQGAGGTRLFVEEIEIAPGLPFSGFMRTVNAVCHGTSSLRAT